MAGNTMEQQRSPGPVRKGRARTGCLTCRSRRVKCDEDRPVCFNCTRLNRVCFYEPSPMYPNPTISKPQTEPRTISDKDTPDFDQPPLSASVTFNSVPDLDPFLGDNLADFNAIFGEWGDIMPTTADPSFGLWTTPENSAGCATNLDLGPTASGTAEFSYFLNHVQPPFIIPWDMANWICAKADIADLAGRNQTIRAAVLAVEELYEALEQGAEIAATLPSYFTAKSAYTMAIREGQLSIDQLLVATFLLCCFEVVAQQETVSSTLKQKDLLVTTIEGHLSEKPWSLLAQRTMIWLYLFHAKALHLGGRGMLSPKLLSLVEDQLNPLLCMPVKSGSVSSSAVNVVTHSLQQALFQFYFQLQQISVTAASINRHHRPRGAPADEALVDGISHTIERQVLNLWHGRPAILDCTDDTELAMMLPSISPQELSLISLLSRLCKLCYYAEIIYYSRSQGRADSSSRRIQPAREAIRKLIDESAGAADDDMCLLRQPALAWPLFLYSVESRSQNQVDWAIERFNTITKRPLWHIDFIQTMVRELTHEQLQKGDRVDSRFFCVENYGVAPPFL